MFHEERLTVYGVPEPKGSTRAFPRKTAGGKVRAVTTSSNPNLKGWESLVREEAARVARERGVFFRGAVSVSMEFYLVRPRSVTRRRRPDPTAKPDLDKLIRGCLDPLSGVLFVDDAQVCAIAARKSYAENGSARAVIKVGGSIVRGDEHGAAMGAGSRTKGKRADS